MILPMSEPPVLCDVVADRVAVVTLNRPDRGNAWNPEMERLYFEVLDDCARRPDVRVVVVTGAGRSWCVGADMAVVSAASESGGRLRTEERPDPRLTVTMPIPIIAAINGGCAGRGLVQALHCDVRFAASGAKFSTSFARRGLSSEYGISWLLPRLIGTGPALDVLLSGRVFLAEEAASMGLVSGVVAPEELLDHCLRYATDLALNCSPTAMSAIKAQVWRQLDLDWDTSVAESIDMMKISVTRPDIREGVASFVEKRPPEFPADVEPWARPTPRA